MFVAADALSLSQGLVFQMKSNPRTLLKSLNTRLLSGMKRYMQDLFKATETLQMAERNSMMSF
jgi:hypothetical protein